MKIFFLCLFLLWISPAPEALAEPPFADAAQEFVGQSDAYIGRRFKARFPMLYSRLVSICCLKDGSKRSEIRWYPQDANKPGRDGERLCRAVFLSANGIITRVEILGEGCGP